MKGKISKPLKEGKTKYDKNKYIGELKAKPPVPPNKNMEDKKWDEDKAVDFVNWYIRLHKLGVRYELENQTIIDSFENGDDYKVWH